jgi:hypothetical protein
MKFPAQIQSFRARLLLLLALMLGLTLGVQYYFNLRTVRSNARMIIEQEQAIMTGIALGLESLQSARYLDEIISDLREPLPKDKNVRVKNILVVGTSETASSPNSVHEKVKTRRRASFNSKTSSSCR